MERLPALVVALSLVAASAATAAPNPVTSAFTRAANSPAGRAVFDLEVVATSVAETWKVVGQDVTPFHYEQGMAHHDGGELIFSSRNSLTRTSVGCPDPLSVPGEGCYDVRDERIGVIPSAQMAQGFDHVGGIDVGQAGPAEGIVFAPLETAPPRTRRGLAAYDLNSFGVVGLLVEEVPHRYHSWVAIDPTGRYLIATEDGFNPIRVYEIARDGYQRITFTRRADLDVKGSPASLPNTQGCKFASATTLYCSNWVKRDSYFDIRSEIYRIDLSAPIGTAGATANGALAFSFKAQPNYASGVPYGLETEDLAFWGGQLHVQLRGEALGWTHIVHLAQE